MAVYEAVILTYKAYDLEVAVRDCFTDVQFWPKADITTKTADVRIRE